MRRAAFISGFALMGGFMRAFPPPHCAEQQSWLAGGFLFLIALLCAFMAVKVQPKELKQ